MSLPHEPYWNVWIGGQGNTTKLSEAFRARWIGGQGNTAKLSEAFRAGFEAGMLHRAKILSNPDALTEEERQLVADGHLVQAIKEVRHRTGLSLKESKDLVDRHRGLS